MSNCGEQKQKAAAAAKYQPGSHTSEGGLYLIGCDLPELMPRKKQKMMVHALATHDFFPPESTDLLLYILLPFFFLPLSRCFPPPCLSQFWAGVLCSTAP